MVQVNLNNGNIRITILKRLEGSAGAGGGGCGIIVQLRVSQSISPVISRAFLNILR